MKKLVEGFTRHLKEALEIAENQKFNPESRDIQNVLILGMGGSGIGGSIAAQVLSDKLSIPVLSCKDYSIPAFVSEKTLIIASSYSGNTEETLMALDLASQKSKNIVCITSGGRIQQIAEQKKFPCICIPSGMPPRGAFGYSFPQLFSVFNQYGLISGDYRTEFSNAIKQIDSLSESIYNEALTIAKLIKNKLPIIYAESGYEGVCVRFRQQLNENSKKLCWHHVVPEMNHNELVGWKLDAGDKAVVLLRNKSDLAQNSKRMDLSLEIFKKYNPSIVEIFSNGENKLERTLYLIHLTDWISVLIAELNGTDAVEIEVINHFKSELAKS